MRRTAARNAVRNARELIASGNEEAAQTAIREAASLLDRAARKGVLHPNNAARRKSRLMRLATATAAPAPEGNEPRKRRTGGTDETSSTRTKKD